MSRSLWSQERGIPVYSDYLTDNLYLLHPAMAGAASQSKIRLTGRTQWFGVKDAPHLETFSINGRVGEKTGLGGILYNDQNGRVSQQGMMAGFAYHLLMSRDEIDINQLSFGMNVGLIQEAFDESGLVGPGQPADPSISGNNQKSFGVNIDVGLSYYFYEFFTHLTIKNLIAQQSKIFSDEFESDNHRTYLWTVGYNIYPRASHWSFEPSVMLQYKDRIHELLGDLNGKAYYALDWGQVWGGLSYRTTFSGAEYYKNDLNQVKSQRLQYVTPFVGVNYKSFVFAYTYSYQANDVVLDKSGYHQITLGYNFGKSRTGYQCGCPTINR